jgi:DNA helicase-2/ATP-dependent DNA helicase PcrA
MIALTFTRVAGAEMKSRVVGLIGDEGKKLFANTFHSWCAESVRENAGLAGYSPDFSVYGQEEADGLLAEVLRDMRFTKVTVSQARGRRDGLGAIQREQAESAMREYGYRLRRANAMDFDGLVSAAKSLMAIQETLARYRRQYKHVFVDEFQDTDPDQWDLVNLLAPENLFIVGDDFQSIYKFRGADVSIILRLAENPAWKVVKLERNYRSTKPIVAAANALIRHNRQTEKTLTADKDGADVSCHVAEDEEAEIRDIAYALKDAAGRKKTVAILARTNRQLELAGRILTECGVPHERPGADPSPLRDEGARGLLAWIAAIENPQDDAAVKKAAAAKVRTALILEAEKEQLTSGGTLMEALGRMDKGGQFLDLYARQAAVFRKDGEISAAANRLVVSLGIDDGGARHAISKWAQRQADLGEPATAAGLLDWVRMCDVAEKPTKEITPGMVYLMTAHGSKGLEFDEVFIIGAAQGTFPSRGDIEEERRLFYVAMTRARERLTISRPYRVADWRGNLKTTEESQFVREASGGGGAGAAAGGGS